MKYLIAGSNEKQPLPWSVGASDGPSWKRRLKKRWAPGLLFQVANSLGGLLAAQARDGCGTVHIPGVKVWGAGFWLKGESCH